ncbi:serpin family protein [Papillibacter cinnamivorans]|uniref:Serpin B n=1 Tax=Papillibacter cinnamivorans DSM 12816 TaxID=1122930 RepID=A0A1W1ZJ70_9FIRM|nr:serpin family protein [Papillibacter cinnamivorans]SMC48590.1 serpin B [Papillibacter cinnamivorans DSM 12816]
MKRRVLAGLICIGLLFGSFTGCIQAKAADLTAGYTANSVNTEGALTDEALDSLRSFSMELFRQSLVSGEENTLVSPTSVLLALALTANGASGDMLKEFEAVLGQEGLSLTQIDLACKALMEQYGDTGGSTVLRIANSIWYDEGFAAEKAFLQTDADYFGAPAFQKSFRDSGTADEVNAWIEEATGGLIPKMLDKIDAETVMFLINALYLKATWQSEFDPNDNYDGEFTTEEGTAVPATFMTKGISREQYIDTGDETGVLLPYDDGKLAFLALLPEEGTSASDYAASLDGDSIGNLIAAAEDTSVLLGLPKFKAECGLTLNDTLKAMGLVTAFDPDKADFSAMGKLSQGNVYVGSVLHRTVLKVDEKGTEAAAATIVEMSGTSMPMDYVTLRFDRPFVYAVVDLANNLPVFIGVMDNTAA